MVEAQGGHISEAAEIVGVTAGAMDLGTVFDHGDAG